MKKIFSIFAILFILAVPALALADAGHAASEPHGIPTGAMHLHDDGSVHNHGSSGFELATPWSPKWWTLMGISLILMGFLSIWVNKYLQVQ
jgi:hypothetical protein